MNFDLQNKVALVTGAAQGIGKEIALVLAESGADIVINDINRDGACEQLRNDIHALGRKAIVAYADLTIERDVATMFDEVTAHFRTLDILINNAGTSHPQDIFETSLDDWQKIVNTNMTSAFLCSKKSMEIMRTNRFGRIVNISSVVGEQGALKGHVHYAATKSALLGMTKTLARTGASYGINVNAIAPGVIETDLFRSTHGPSGTNQADQIISSIPLGLGRTRDIGLVTAFLCSEASRYITGATIDVNGGMYMR